MQDLGLVFCDLCLKTPTRAPRIVFRGFYPINREAYQSLKTVSSKLIYSVTAMLEMFRFATTWIVLAAYLVFAFVVK